MNPTGAPGLPPKPVPPDPGECCGGGCARCVFDVYEEQLERWERECAEILGRQPGGPASGGEDSPAN